jgi:hypothetical protein
MSAGRLGKLRLNLIMAAMVASLAGCMFGQGPAAAAPTVATPGLRGELMSAASCIRVEKPSQHVTEPAMSLVPVRAVSSLTVCHQPGTAGTDRDVAPGQPSFKALVTAFAQANGTTKVPNVFCPSYADSLIQVLARTPTGVYWLEVPHDMCGHYLRRPFNAYSTALADPIEP